MTFDKQSYFRFIQLEKSLAGNSVEAYERDIERYVQFLENTGITKFDQVEEEHVSKFIKTLRVLGLSSKSIARNISAIKGLHKFLAGERRSQYNPTQNIELPKKGKHLPDVLSLDEINGILNAADPAAETATKL
ncbi:MAG: site-specific integrase, partial [Bacteroidota bacterium]